MLFISTRDDTTTTDFAELFFKHVKCYFNFSQSIVTDYDSCIILDFWREVCKMKIIKHRLSIIYHAQTDGQSEVLNQIVKDYLCVYISKD